MTYTKHLIIPDTQVKPDVPVSHLDWAGQYIVEKRPDVIVHLGDHWDLPSLSSYDKSDKPGLYATQRIKADLEAGDRALDLLEARLAKASDYRPRKIILIGNHEQRFDRFILANPQLDGLLTPPWYHAAALGWEVISFLEPVVVDGVAYCHYFCRSANGSVVNSKRGAPSARAQVNREMRSCTAGHKQGLDVHIQPVGDGMKRGVIAGSFYQHEEAYLTPQGTSYWRGLLVKHEVHQGNYNLMEVSMDYLKRKFQPAVARRLRRVA